MFIKTKKILSLIISVGVLFSFCNITIFAQGQSDLSDFEEYYSEFTIEEQRRIQEITNSPNSADWLGIVVENVPLGCGISTYNNCPSCYGPTVSVCRKEATLVQEGYHRNAFGILTDCYAYYFYSTGYEMCSFCGTIGDSLPSHLCWEIHKKCNLGDYDACIMDIS